MWCSSCKEDFPEVAGAEVQICPKCMAGNRAGRRQHRVPKLEATGKKSKKNTLSGHPKLRFDQAHGIPREKLPPVIPLESTTRPDIHNQQPGNRSLKHAIPFGLLVFLLGQGVLVWAFLAGHFAAWCVGNLVSIIGVAISFISVSQTIDVMEKRINKLGTAAWQASKKKKKASRKSRKSHKPNPTSKNRTEG